MTDLSYLVANDSFIACPLLPTDDFIRYCKDRGLDISRENLEDLERMGILFPIARVTCPTLTVKIERTEDGNGYTELGVFQCSENNGPARQKRNLRFFILKKTMQRIFWSMVRYGSRHSRPLDSVEYPSG